MPYSATTWADAPSTSSPLDAANLNNLETQYAEAMLSFEQDLFTPFVYGASSFVATKDGTTASQLDVTSGVAFPLQTDGTLRRRALTSSTQSTTGHPSTTMFLDLNPDGTWSWGTSHSAVSGHLTIASVTTDSSANIAAVTDARTLSTTLLSGIGGVIKLNKLSSDSGGITSDGSGNLLVSGNSSVGAAETGGGRSVLFYDPTFHILNIQSPQSGSNPTVTRFITWDGSVQKIPFGIGGSTAFTPAYIDNSGNLTAVGISAGSTIFQRGSAVGLTGSHSTAQIALSYGSGVPAALGSNEVYFQIS